MQSHKLLAASTDYIFVRRTEPKVSRLLWVPRKGEKDKHEGIVRHVGPGYIHRATGERIAPTVKVGDRVVFTGDGCQACVIDGEDLVAMHEGLIMLILEPEAGDGLEEAAAQ